MAKQSKDGADANVKGRGRGASYIYSVLREEILTLDLPPATPLDEVQISQRFGLSRSPVREALIRLAGEELVSTLPNKSTMVAPLNLEELPAYMDALDLVQRLTTRLAAEMRTEPELERMKECQAAFQAAHDAGDALAMIETNRDFHLSISAAAHNRYFQEFHARLLDQGRRFLRLYFRSLNDHLPRDIRGEHDQIIQAIEARDADEAERLAHLHTQQVNDRYLSFFAQRRSADISVTYPS